MRFTLSPSLSYPQRLGGEGGGGKSKSISTGNQGDGGGGRSKNEMSIVGVIEGNGGGGGVKSKRNRLRKSLVGGEEKTGTGGRTGVGDRVRERVKAAAEKKRLGTDLVTGSATGLG